MEEGKILKTFMDNNVYIDYLYNQIVIITHEQFTFESSGEVNIYEAILKDGTKIIVKKETLGKTICFHDKQNISPCYFKFIKRCYEAHQRKKTSN